MTQNYEVKGLSFGPYPRGSIIPAFEVIQAGDVAKLIEIGALALTDKAVNVAILPPKAVDVTSSVATEAVLEANKLREDVVKLESALADEKARHTEKARHAEVFKTQAAESVLELDRLRGLLAKESDARKADAAKIAGLTADLATAREEAATWKQLAEEDEPTVPTPIFNEGHAPFATRRGEVVGV
jgi:hypothetical protein